MVDSGSNPSRGRIFLRSHIETVSRASLTSYLQSSGYFFFKEVNLSKHEIDSI
jgi:hypothetical protein